MKNQLRSLLLLVLLVFALNSCVYSLFPLYTEDTLVYLPELVGKWQTGNYPEEYLIIEKFNDEITVTSPTKEPTDSIVGDGWVARFNGEPSIIVGDKTITDRDSIAMYYDRIYGKLDEGNHEMTKALMDTSAKMRELMFLLGDEEELMSTMYGTVEQGIGELVEEKRPRFKGTISVGSSMTYRMTAFEGEEKTEYNLHVVKIGKDYFLDLLPDSEQSDYGFGAIMLPTHTFLKLELKEGQLNLQRFNKERMSDLFDRNMIRLRHELVDGITVITAKPKELQNFIKKYASNEEAFDKVEVYKRVTR